MALPWSKDAASRSKCYQSIPSDRTAWQLTRSQALTISAQPSKIEDKLHNKSNSEHLICKNNRSSPLIPLLLGHISFFLRFKMRFRPATLAPCDHALRGAWGKILGQGFTIGVTRENSKEGLSFFSSFINFFNSYKSSEWKQLIIFIYLSLIKQPMKPCWNIG